eukprot:CAMPEP_0194357900 /NCGR_PEP_ID=MMETSP0174-20130528/5309_1 /TAXON_ID=216777 /ORGANISM="Proboscia alata, Strain PI-D3" /LENGTH=296 /DNA_ID=CAMNT_0039128101 /DNA_START=106 /DNA_END=996 /DNA_ORIENTATION=+
MGKKSKRSRGSPRKCEKKSGSALVARSQLRVHDCDKLNTQIAVIFRPHDNIPRPSLDPDVVPATWNPNCIFDVCETVSMAWQITSSGMNGLRFTSFTQDASGLRVLSTEVCKAGDEDLSSIIKYAPSGEHSDPSLQKAYWLASTFTSCQTIASGLLTMCIELSRSFTFTRAPGDISLILKSARLQFYIIHTTLDVRNEISGVPLDTRSYHMPLEPHSHVVMLLTDHNGIDYVVDLAGSQFGVFGPDAKRPQVVVEEVGKWKDNFSLCLNNDVGTISNDVRPKVALLNKVIKCISTT